MNLQYKTNKANGQKKGQLQNLGRRPAQLTNRYPPLRASARPHRPPRPACIMHSRSRRDRLALLIIHTEIGTHTLGQRDLSKREKQIAISLFFYLI